MLWLKASIQLPADIVNISLQPCEKAVLDIHPSQTFKTIVVLVNIWLQLLERPQAGTGQLNLGSPQNPQNHENNILLFIDSILWDSYAE